MAVVSISPFACSSASSNVLAATFSLSRLLRGPLVINSISWPEYRTQCLLKVPIAFDIGPNGAAGIAYLRMSSYYFHTTVMSQRALAFAKTQAITNVPPLSITCSESRERRLRHQTRERQASGAMERGYRQPERRRQQRRGRDSVVVDGHERVHVAPARGAACKPRPVHNRATRTSEAPQR